MTKLLDQAVETTRGIAPERQDEIAHRMLFYADAPVIQLTPEEDADLAAAGEEIVRGDWRRTNRCAPSGRSTSFEAALCRPRRSTDRRRP